MLPVIDPQLTGERLNFPVRWQAVIFRNYRIVPNDRIAKILDCTAEDVEREAVRLGLRSGAADPDWLSRGFINIIRNNWYLLPYEQLLVLLDYTQERLEFILKNEDFLDVKLGGKKPVCERAVYAPLTRAQIAETEKIAETVKKLDISQRKMFDIYRDKSDRPPRYITSLATGTKMLHPYLTPCADPFLMDSREHLPDALLDDYARVGVNSLVIHAVLSTVSYFPYDPSQSKDAPIRRKNMRDLVERAGKRGIRIVLYFNEPRALHPDVFERYGRPELAGNTADGFVHLCLHVKENYDWFYGAVRDLFTEIPGLGGVYSTTMSENPTNCWYDKEHNNCPHCKDLPVWDGAVLVNNTIQKAMRDAGSNGILYATTWQWSEEMIKNGFPLLDPAIYNSVVSEWGVKTNIGGVPWSVVDYSISNHGPGELAKLVCKTAKENGHNANVKVQMSCTWELAALPYLPLFDLELEHIVAVHNEGVNNFSLTWTLGSYPSITFDLVAAYLEDPEHFTIDHWYETHFGVYARQVHEAVKCFCDGYREYPFSCEVAYNSPKNLGVANRWSLTERNNGSCMVGWSFDDVEYYTRPYPAHIYMAQFEKLVRCWHRGCELLEGIDHALAQELLLFAKVAENHFRADILHTRFALCKRQLPESKAEMRTILAEEKELCLELITLLPRSTMIGYETANHYFYTERDIIEKIVQLDGLKKELEEL